MSAATSTRSDAEDLAARALGREPYEIVRTALEVFGDTLRIASSFGLEDIVVLHHADRAGRELGVVPRVFLLDTGRLHQETYDLVDRVRERYRLDLHVYAPDAAAVEELVRARGPNSFYRSVEDRKACCNIRKVAPLGRALAGARAWMTGMRRAQSVTRRYFPVIETDTDHGGIVKVSPLAEVDDVALSRFIEDNDVPVHALHAKGYPSIGCVPCTRAVAPGEDPRAGRWWWESPEQKECGLHPRRRRT